MNFKNLQNHLYYVWFLATSSPFYCFLTSQMKENKKYRESGKYIIILVLFPHLDIEMLCQIKSVRKINLHLIWESQPSHYMHILLYLFVLFFGKKKHTNFIEVLSEAQHTACGRQNSKMATWYPVPSTIPMIILHVKRGFKDTIMVNYQLTLKSGDYMGGLNLNTWDLWKWSFLQLPAEKGGKDLKHEGDVAATAGLKMEGTWKQF